MLRLSKHGGQALPHILPFDELRAGWPQDDTALFVVFVRFLSWYGL